MRCCFKSASRLPMEIRLKRSSFSVPSMSSQAICVACQPTLANDQYQLLKVCSPHSGRGSCIGYCFLAVGKISSCLQPVRRTFDGAFQCQSECNGFCGAASWNKQSQAMSLLDKRPCVKKMEDETREGIGQRCPCAW